MSALIVLIQYLFLFFHALYNYINIHAIWFKWLVKLNITNYSQIYNNTFSVFYCAIRRGDAPQDTARFPLVNV